MTEEEFRADMLAAVASRAEVQGCGLREAFALEMLERLHDAGEVPDAELCAEVLSGQRGRRLEIDAWSFDDADGSLHLFIAIWDGGDNPANIALTEAREHGFNRLLGVFEQSRDEWLTNNIEESRPLWSLARSIRNSAIPNAIRLHVLTDRPISERLREIPEDYTRQEKVPITFQIWDIRRVVQGSDSAGRPVSGG